MLGVPAEPVQPVSEEEEAGEGEQAAEPALYEGCDITTEDGTKTSPLDRGGESKASVLIDVAGRTVDAGETTAAA